MKEMLTEVYRTVRKVSGVDPSKPGNLKQILVDDKSFTCYVNGLAESIESKKDAATFKLLAENTRINLLENSMFAINPYESLTLPILRVFYPKLVAKEAVTVSPMDKPECVKAFIRATFAATNGTQYPAPAVTGDVSNGPTMGIQTTATMAVPSTNFDVLGAMSQNNSNATLERDWQILSVSEDGTNFMNVSIVPAVEGQFSAAVTYANSDTDVLSGVVNYLSGTVTCLSATGKTKWISYQTSVSLEYNKINPTVQLTVDKIRLYAKDRQISANWTINMEQDLKALFDVSMQAEIVNLLGQQIALDIDRELINSLITANNRLNASSHTASFNRTAPVGYSWGNKYWHENILPVLNTLSAQVYTDTNIDAANTILANPLDVAILEDLQGFNYTGTSSLDGDVGYRSATVAGGKWKVLTSSVVSQGQMILIYKPQEELKSIFFYSPYVPAVLHPYPLGAIPSLTILSRYATALVRSNGIATLTIGA